MNELNKNEILIIIGGYSHPTKEQEENFTLIMKDIICW